MRGEEADLLPPLLLWFPVIKVCARGEFYQLSMDEVKTEEASSSSSYRPARTRATHAKNIFPSLSRRSCGLSRVSGDRECFVRRLEVGVLNWTEDTW